jgi:Amt family ammonium transporter
VHGVGGIVGALLTGVLAVPSIGGVEGSLLNQAIGVGATLAYSGIVTVLILGLVNVLVGLRVTRQQELDGLDLSLHGEQVA